MLSNDRKLKNIQFSFIDKSTKQSRTVNLIEHDNIDVKYYGKNNKITHTYGEIIKIGEYSDSGKKYILVLDYDYYAEENIHSIDLTKLYTIVNVVHSSEPYSFSPVYCADETVALVKAEGSTFKFTTNGRDWIEVHGGSEGITRHEVEEMIDAATENFLTADEIDQRISTATADFVTLTTVQQEISDATADLASKDEVSAAISTAVAPLATKVELDTAIEEVKEQVVGAFHFRGKVDTVADLDNISDPEDGDVYEVVERSSEFAYNGTEWVELGSVFDLSAYATKAECDTYYDAIGSAATAESNAKSYADSHFDAKGSAAQALQDAKDYADANFDAKGSATSAENAAKAYADTLANDTLQDAKDYADNNFDPKGSADQALQDSKDYADANFDAKGSAAQALQDAKDYADGLAGNYDAAGAAAQALQDAKDYADANFDEKGAAAQAYSDAKYYADTADAATLRDAQDYADEHFDVIGSAAAAESNANTYTDQQIAAAIAVADVYQKCVDHGYTGTEEEFYDALADILNHHNVITTTIEVND